MSLLISLLFLIPLSFASLETISIKNLNMNYLKPFGQGEVEKVTIGLSLVQVPYPVEVERVEKGFAVRSQYLDLTWYEPFVLAHDMEEFHTKALSLDGGIKKHSLSAEKLGLRPANQDQVFTLEQVSLLCDGVSEEKDFEDRLLADCLKFLELRIKQLDVPTDFILVEIMNKLPRVPEEVDIPANAVKVNISEGNFFLEAYLKYYFYAGLRAWGHVSHDVYQKQIVMKVDRIRFGYLPVTSIVMNKLKELIKSPKVQIDPPYIRIDLK